MTCIVAISDGKRIVMGGDSAGSSPDNTEIYRFSISKVFAKGEYLIGICGSYRAGQIARWKMTWPEPPGPGADLEEFMVLEVVEAIQRNLVAANFAGPTEGTRAAQFIIGLRGRIFTTAGDFTVGDQDAPWQAIGSGRHHAYGALHVLADFDLALEDKVRRALGAAQSHTCNVQGPFHLLSVG